MSFHTFKIHRGANKEGAPILHPGACLPAPRDPVTPPQSGAPKVQVSAYKGSALPPWATPQTREYRSEAEVAQSVEHLLALLDPTYLSPSCWWCLSKRLPHCPWICYPGAAAMRRHLAEPERVKFTSLTCISPHWLESLMSGFWNKIISCRVGQLILYKVHGP